MKLFFLLCLVMLVMPSCQEGHVHQPHDQTRDHQLSGRLDRMSEALKGWPVSSLSHIVGAPVAGPQTPKLLFLFNGFSCDVCVDKGLILLQHLAKELDPDQILVIASDVNIQTSRLHSGYAGKIHET